MSRLIILLLVLSPALVWGADYGKSRSLEVEVSPVLSGSELTLRVSWPAGIGLGEYKLQILNGLGESRYEVIPSTGASSYQYDDTTAVSGERKEYRIVSKPVAGGHSAYGHALGGYALPLVEDRGGIVLLVDSAQSQALASELARLESDLVGDGWTVYREDVSGSETPPQLKARIRAAHSNHSHINTVFLFGDLAVPYSGNNAPDGHLEHYGAWPADAYYGELDDTWTDSRIYNTSATRSETHNVPGDGKFDTNRIYSGVELAVGRVDLADLPAFTPLTETDLLRRYLNKNHAFRHRAGTISNRALVDDNLSYLSEGVAAASRRSFPALVGRAQVDDLPWSTAQSQDYLFGFGAGTGSYTRATGIATTADCVQNPSKVCFSFIFGSYFGDFDTTNNLLRAQLASEDFGLSACWGARPYWGVYHMALGGTLGDVMKTVFNQRTSSYYHGGLMQRNVHAALLGDPTLRAHPVAPAANIHATSTQVGLRLQWDASPAAELLGYHIYRANLDSQDFSRLTEQPIRNTTFTDSFPVEAGAHYMVRAIHLQETPSGSYINASQGTYVTTSTHASDSPVETWTMLAFSDPSAEQGSAANPDGDELSNLLEYALGTDPMVSGPFPMTLSLEDGTLSYTENTLAIDATIICEMSDDLVGWIPVAFHSQTFKDLASPVPGTQVRRVTLHLSAIPEVRCHFRLRVELP